MKALHYGRIPEQTLNRNLTQLSPGLNHYFHSQVFLLSFLAAIYSNTILQAAWDSLHPEYIATANGGDIHLTDTRANRFVVLGSF